MPKEFHLSKDAEKREYDLHENDPQDQGYRDFLNRLAIPLQKLAPSASRAIDFGCGPGPTLHFLLAKFVARVDNYDPIYFNDKSLLSCQYDLVTATEVLEHLREPCATLETIRSLIKPAGVFGGMTKLFEGKSKFPTWHYKNDPTHIVFYAVETLEFIAHQWRAKLDFVAKDAFVFTLPGEA